MFVHLSPFTMDRITCRILESCTEAKTLRVIIPEELSHPDSFDKDSGAFVFTRAYPNTPASTAENEVQILVKSVIHESNHSTVYLGLLKSVQVVVKCCYDVEFYKEFKQEAKIYEKRLGGLQGDIVPAFFGYYRSLDDEYGPYSLLLLEYCGERISRSFHDLDRGKRYVMSFCLLRHSLWLIIVTSCPKKSTYSQHVGKVSHWESTPSDGFCWTQCPLSQRQISVDQISWLQMPCLRLERRCGLGGREAWFIYAEELPMRFTRRRR